MASPVVSLTSTFRTFMSICFSGQSVKSDKSWFRQSSSCLSQLLSIHPPFYCFQLILHYCKKQRLEKYEQVLRTEHHLLYKQLNRELSQQDVLRFDQSVRHSPQLKNEHAVKDFPPRQIYARDQCRSCFHQQ